jgi:hypothetical protein
VIRNRRTVSGLAVLLLLVAPAIPSAGAQSGAKPDSIAPAAVPAPASAAPDVKPVTFYAAWRAPWGTPRATDHLMVSCTDEEVRDTLYLTFDPGRDSTIFGMIGEVYFRAQPSDTLGPLWWLGGGALS